MNWKFSKLLAALIVVGTALAFTACAKDPRYPDPPRPVPDETQDEQKFRSDWDYAVKRLRYDDVVLTWREPASIIEKSDKEFVAIWHWDRAVSAPPIAAPPSEGRHIAFGDRMELTFDRTSKLLQSWTYTQWGAHAGTYRSRKVLPPSRSR